MGVLYNTTLKSETIIDFLALPTADDTQTAFAREGIHISEKTAEQWRMLAEKDILYCMPPEKELVFDDSELPIKQHCLDKIKRKWIQMIKGIRCLSSSATET